MTSGAKAPNIFQRETSRLKARPQTAVGVAALAATETPAKKKFGPLGPEGRVQAFLKTFVQAGVRFYQAALRPLNPWACKFPPSCSEYALEAVERHGLGRGVRLTLARLLRCRPGVFGGYDPVPLELCLQDQPESFADGAR